MGGGGRPGTVPCRVRPIRLLIAGWLLCALSLACLGATPASAAKVGNPGPFGAIVSDMVVRIGGGNPGEVHGVAFPVARGGTISAEGAVHVPRSGLAFPPVTYTDETYGTGTYTIRFVPTGDATGSLDPLTGLVSINVQFWAKLESERFDLGSGCGVGSPASPIALTLTTGRTNPPPPTAPFAGSLYDQRDGRLTVVNNSVALPATTNCNPPFGDALNLELHLPSAAGRNSVVMAGRLQPLIIAERPMVAEPPLVAEPPPSITGLRLRPRTFRTRARRYDRGSRPGTKVTYRLSEAATTRFSVERSRPGRRRGRSCVKQTRRTRRGRRCTRWVRVRGSFSRVAGPGPVSFRFGGRIGGRRLRPGHYRLAAVPRDALGSKGPAKRARFRVKR
jgi:hypothetical protein